MAPDTAAGWGLLLVLMLLLSLLVKVKVQVLCGAYGWGAVCDGKVDC
jgi:hypothetical protein